VGFALEDFSALRFMMDSAVRLGMGERMALIPQLSDPKNLFGSLNLVTPAALRQQSNCIAA
jgi:ornithine cyclodeaminase